jgi:uncharacterized protein with PIN domain
MDCIHIVTETDMEEIVEREKKAKENYGNYECPFCRRYIWWDAPHVHKVGEKVKIRGG